MLYTGMRVGEITGLRWCDIDLEDETISVNHTLVYYDKRDEERCTFSINTTKTKAGDRTIPMLPKVKDAFIMEKEYQVECGLKSKAVRALSPRCVSRRVFSQARSREYSLRPAKYRKSENPPKLPLVFIFGKPVIFEIWEAKILSLPLFSFFKKSPK